MHRLTALIRADREYQGFLDTLRQVFLRSEELYPIAVNGLSGGAEDAFIVESVSEALKLSPVPCVIFAGSDTERDKIVSRLCDGGIRAMAYKRCEPVFHNIRASHDVERERLGVLFSILSGECEAVVTTPSAALSYTMPRSVLSSMAARLAVGTVISPEELSKRLSALGFAHVEAVEGRGQFSRRGGIVDFFGGEGEHPVRIEFFGDEIDRLVYFDAISQRTLGECAQPIIRAYFSHGRNCKHCRNCINACQGMFIGETVDLSTYAVGIVRSYEGRSFFGLDTG